MRNPEQSPKILGVIIDDIDEPKLIPEVDLSIATQYFYRQKFKSMPNIFDLPFYDWLRNPVKGIIGVRFFHSDDKAFNFIIGKRNVVDHRSSSQPLSFSIFFGAEREFQPGKSQDQDFGGNELFVGDCQSSLLTFFAPNEKILGLP